MTSLFLKKKKIRTNLFIIQNRNRPTDLVARGQGGGKRIAGEFGMGVYTLIYFK